MKFGKQLKQQIQETLPDWRDKFLSYKELKRQVKLISSSAPVLLNTSDGGAEAGFVVILNNEIDKFNAFFMEQEEDFIIRHKELQHRIQLVVDTWGSNGNQPSEILYKEAMEKIRKDIVDFHGEMVLLENYSNINYTGLAKILKKYDKRTGSILRLPFIQKVLEQPFFTTDLVSKLVKECEVIIDFMFPVENEYEQRQYQFLETKIESKSEGIFRNTIVALMTMQEMRRGSSTYGQFSLPPLNIPESDLVKLIQLNSSITII